MTVAYIVTILIPSLSFLILGPLAGIVGISGGILASRGLNAKLPKSEAERRRELMELNTEAADIFIDRLQRLPSGTPKIIKDDIHQRLIALNTGNCSRSFFGGGLMALSAG